MDEIEGSGYEPTGPFSNGIKYGNFVFTTQGGVHPDGAENTVSDISEQTKLVLDHTSSVLEEAGSSLDNVVQVMIYMTDMNDYNKINSVYSTYFDEPYPVRGTVEISSLPIENVKIKMETTAIIPED